MDLRAEARALVQGLSCRLGPSPYDIAWLARIPANGSREPRWPELVDWLLEHQWPDGSWGGAIPYYHDRILCTLTSMISLKERGEHPAVAQAIARGEQYVWNNVHFLFHDPIELVGFELLLPTLLAQARALDLDVPSHSCGYGRIRAAKLRLLPVDLLYEPGNSVAFSLEFMGNKVDSGRLSRIVAENGSIACSPATTAYLLLHDGQNRQAVDYLESTRRQPHGIPHFHPFRTFEIAWVLEHLAFGGLLQGDGEMVQPAVWAELQAALTAKGASMDPWFGIADGDTTAVASHALMQSGRPVDPLVMRHFENPETRIFRTFRFERNASVSTNAHALEVLALMPDYPDRQEVWTRIVTMFLASRQYQSYWVDKWHGSPYYATSHVLISLLSADDPLFSEFVTSIEWLVHMQRDDGGWGYFAPSTLEESAYALLALLHYYRKFRGLDVEALRKGAAFLYRGGGEANVPLYPDLWIAKSLFSPQDVIRSAILAALALYQDIFGHPPD
jgi:halimadienyl-diphosphate synthase